MRFIHTADLHLYASLKGSVFKDRTTHEKRVYELRDAFFRLLNHITENAIDCLFIAGDLFDHPFINIESARAIFTRLADLDADVFLLIGNHDAFLLTEAYQSLLASKNIHVFNKDTTTIKQEGIAVHGLNTSEFSTERLATLEAALDTTVFNVLLLHGDVQNKKDDHYLTDLKRLEATAFDYIALGHIHKHAFLTDRIAYSGNLEPLDFSETDQKGFIEGTIEDKQLETRFVPFAKRAYVRKTLQIGEDWDEDALLERIRNLWDEKTRTTDFIRITLKGRKGLHLDLDTAKIARLLSDDFYHLEIRDETTSSLDLNQLKKAYPDTIIDVMITQYEAAGDKSDEAALILALETLLKESGGV